MEEKEEKESGDHMWCAILSESISLKSTGIIKIQ